MRFAVTQSSIGRDPILHEVGLLYATFLEHHTDIAFDLFEA